MMTVYPEVGIIFHKLNMITPSADIEEIVEIDDLFGEQHAAVSGKRSIRFVSPDPVNGTPEDPLSWNRYLYCRDDPINYFDPDGEKVTNSTSFTIYYKLEKYETAIPIYPGETFPGTQDGIADPVHHPGVVYKTSDGINIIVHEDGRVEEYGGNLIQKIYQFGHKFLTGEWKNSKWKDNLNKKGDEGWDALFDKANDPLFGLEKDLQKIAEENLKKAIRTIGSLQIEVSVSDKPTGDNKTK